MCESSFSPAVWAVVEDSICTILPEGTKPRESVIALRVASACELGKQGLISTIRSFTFALLYGRGKNRFLHNLDHFLFFCVEKY